MLETCLNDLKLSISAIVSVPNTVQLSMRENIHRGIKVVITGSHSHSDFCTGEKLIFTSEWRGFLGGLSGQYAFRRHYNCIKELQKHRE